MARVVFLGLNAVRVLSIVGLLLVFASSIVAIVTNIKTVNRFHANRIANPTDAIPNCDYIVGTTVPNRRAGLFWAIFASSLIIFQVIILILSELRWPALFFARFFPVLGNDFGLGALGLFQVLIGAQILPLHAVDEFTLVSAFFLFAVGCLNMLLGLVFRDGAKSRRSLRGEEKKGVIIGDVRPRALDTAPRFQIPARARASRESTDQASDGFGRQGETAAEESLPPPYAPRTPTFAGPEPPMSSRHREILDIPRRARVL
ncbi:hypothetical protein GGX14DRAFT_405239 [Mycena pura]|uniref:DUF7598 domain-containing protein n=1 Tax=Mycena pura TaxID=153505 RepID=A0AAD6UT14_9AGAR|nr:hypothetical protein GGX14DRAFT_405239 [Mycena pura]